MARLNTDDAPVPNGRDRRGGTAEHGRCQPWRQDPGALIQLLAAATGIACTKIAGPGLAALQAGLDQACAIPKLYWERRAAAHAEFLNALADAAGDPQLTPVFSSGAGFAYDLMITAGPAADGIVINSRNRLLARLRAGDADEVAAEVEEHFRILHFMGRLAAPPAQRASA
jgi:DNA-binding GntR family transcriptional regulator